MLITVAVPVEVELRSGDPLRFPRDRGEPVRARLRQATAHIHERLHRHPGFAALNAGVLTVSGYADLLGRLYGFHAPLEHGLRAAFATTNPSVAGDIDPVVREKAHLLFADLMELGVSEGEIGVLPVCGTLPALDTPEQRAGCLYVIEGAGLGGAAMARGLDYLLGPDRRSGRTFLLGRNDPGHVTWPEFCRWLEVMADHADTAEIIASAQRTFEAMARWLSPRDDPGQDNV